jgi:hypothetical protein
MSESCHSGSFQGDRLPRSYDLDMIQVEEEKRRVRPPGRRVCVRASTWTRVHHIRHLLPVVIDLGSKRAYSSMSSMLKGGHSAARYNEDEALQKAIALSMGSSTEPCQVCDKDLGPLSPNRRQQHYDEHFSSSPEGMHSQSWNYVIISCLISFTIEEAGASSALRRNTFTNEAQDSL